MICVSRCQLGDNRLNIHLSEAYTNTTYLYTTNFQELIKRLLRWPKFSKVKFQRASGENSSATNLKICLLFFSCRNKILTCNRAYDNFYWFEKKNFFCYLYGFLFSAIASILSDSSLKTIKKNLEHPSFDKCYVLNNIQYHANCVRIVSCSWYHRFPTWNLTDLIGSN